MEQMIPRPIRRQKKDARCRGLVSGCRSAKLGTHLGKAHERRDDVGEWPMEKDICPASDGIFGAQFPCLETGVVLKVMKRLEKVEHCEGVSRTSDVSHHAHSPSSQSCIFAYIAAPTLTNNNNLTANEKPGKNGPFLCLPTRSCKRPICRRFQPLTSGPCFPPNLSTSVPPCCWALGPAVGRRKRMVSVPGRSCIVEEDSRDISGLSEERSLL